MINRELLRSAWVEIDLDAIRHNIKEIRQTIGPLVEIMAAVKAEAYGHGAVEVAKTALNAGATWLGVAIPEEGILLREAGLNSPILIFGPLQPEQVLSVIKYDLTATICNYDSALELSKEAVKNNQTAGVHLKIDTGMGRIGIRPEEAGSFLKRLRELPGIKVSGIFSHLATADAADKSYAMQQVSAFTNVVNNLKGTGLLPEKVHLANSAGIIDLPSSYFNMVRPGIMLYGLYPSKEVSHDKIKLKPALSLKAKVSFSKKTPPGTGLSYEQKYHTNRESIIATLPIGYGDGWSRRLSHKAQVLINGRKYPIVGTICMDQCMVDVGDEEINPGQEAVLIGKDGEMEITADMVAEQLGTINYEVTCMLNNRLPRVYVNRG